MATTAYLLSAVRLRLNDQGDNTENPDGSANAQYFWADSDIVIALNAAQYDLYSTLVDTKKKNELKNLLATGSSSPLPANFYKGLSAQVNGTKAVLIDDPKNQYFLNSTTQLTVSLYGLTVVTTPSAQPFTVLYWKLPTAFVLGDATDHTEMTEQFYEQILAIAEFYLVYKDSAQVRTILRRKFGEEDIEFIGVLDYLQHTT